MRYFLLLSLFRLVAAVQIDAQTPPAPQADAPAPVPVAPPAPADPNLLGKVNTSSGEGRRNENIQFNQIDNNAIKETQNRNGTTATAIEEFRVDQAYYGAEFGNRPGTLIHLTTPKPLNQWRGSIFETHGDSVFTARSYFQFGPVKPARVNHFGFEAGGRLWKNSFLSIEGSDEKNSGYVNGNVLVPLPSERTPLTKDPAVARYVQKLIDAYPLELPNRTDIDPRALNTNAPQTIDTWSTSEILNQRLTPRDAVIARHTLVLQKVAAFAFIKGQNPDTTTRTHDARLTWLHTIDPHTQLSLTAGFDRNHTLLVPKSDAVGPTVTISGYTGLGPASTLPIDRAQNRFRWSGLASRQQGRHAIIAGLEVTRLQFNGRETSSNRGTFTFRSNFGNDGITNFRLGLPDRASTGAGDINRGFRYLRGQYFAGDTWKISDRLTVSYGVRYTPMTGPSEVNNRTQVKVDCDCNNVGPRFGVAWKLSGHKGVIRANYGVHFGEILPTTYQQLRWDPPDFIKAEVQAPDLLNPYGNTYLGPGARAAIYVVPRDLKTPYSQQYNFLWEREIAGHSKLQLVYTGSRSWKLFFMDYTNRALPVGTLTTANITDRRPNQAYYDVRKVQNTSRGYFDAARATMLLPPWRGFSGDASYWLSKAIDTGASYVNTAAGDDITQGFSQSEFLITQDLKGPSNFDQSHAVLTRLNYSLRRWTMSAIFLAKTGMPFTVITGSDSPGFGNVDGVNGDRPNVIDPSVLGRTISNPDTAPLLLPRSAFAYIRPGDLRGNLGSNTFRKGGIRNLNASLSRQWELRSRALIAFRAEAINLTNTPQFAEPATELTSPSFGKITNTLNDGRTFRFTVRLGF